MTDTLQRNPHKYLFVKIGPLAAGFVFNLFMVIAVFTEVYKLAKAHNQQLWFYVREILWGGINPLPHYTDLRAGALSEVDYEVRAVMRFQVRQQRWT